MSVLSRRTRPYDEEMDFHDSLHLTCERRFNEEAEYWRVYHGFPKHPLVRSGEAATSITFWTTWRRSETKAVNPWDRRKAKLDRKRQRIRKHGKNLAQIYAAAVRKKADKARKDSKCL